MSEPTVSDYEAIRSFQDYCYSEASKRGFYDEPRQLQSLLLNLRDTEPVLADFIQRAYIGNRLMLLSGEIAEAHEEIRSGHDPEETYYEVSRDSDGWVETDGTAVLRKPEGVPSELADVFIRLMDLCGELDIDLAAAVQEKLTYNATRSYKHGRTF